jgi:hypothetical protein
VQHEKIEWKKKRKKKRHWFVLYFMLVIINGVVVSNRYKLALENMFVKQD